MDDWKLLNEYASRNSEEAFRALVERYAGMVYHAALRQLGSAHAAEEVTQAVFIALARKAGRISRKTVLCGWLFRAMRYAALNHRREEACRQRHEQEAMNMDTMMPSEDADSSWEQISSHLNDALDALAKADRELVMVRYFGNKSHKEVAQSLGVSEDTAKKRLSRALEKLRMIFARRGVAVPVVALTAALAAHGAQAAPAGLAAATTAAALASRTLGTAGTVTSAKAILKLMAWAKAKMALVVGAGVLVAAGTATMALRAVDPSGDDLIGQLESRSGKIIVAEQRLKVPATIDIKNMPLEQALDQIAVPAEAYWTIDYAVYSSDQKLTNLIALLREGSELQSGGWSNLSAQALRPSLTVQADDGEGRRRIMKMRSGAPSSNDVSMVVVPKPEAKWLPKPGDGPRQVIVKPGEAPPADNPMGMLIHAMREGINEGVLAPERLLSEVDMAVAQRVATPLPATPEMAAKLAKAAHARWTTIYTLRKSPMPDAGIKLVHGGMKEADDMPTKVVPGREDLVKGLESNRFKLSPEDRAAHHRAVDAYKQQK